MKAFKDLFRDLRPAEAAMAAAVAIAFAMIAVRTEFGAPPVSRESPCCGPPQFDDFRAPRA